MRLSLASFVVLTGLIGVAVFVEHQPAKLGTAAGLDALSPTASVSLPQPIEWSGHISRIFVSGEGLEIISSASPGGVFQAYMPRDQTSPVTEGSARIKGLWTGFTCAYGGDHGRCVPEVDIEEIKSAQ